MRIIYLHQYFTTPDMPGGTRSYEMARRLVAAGHEVHMVTTWHSGETDQRTWFETVESGIHVHWLPLPYSNYMSYRKRIMVFLRFAFSSAIKAASLKGDIVFATSTPLTIALPGLYASMRNRIPMVFEVRDLWPEVPIAMGVIKNPLLIRLARKLEKITYKRSSAIVALAPGMKIAICNQGIDSSKVHVIPNGSDFDIFSNQDIVPADLPGFENGNIAILYFGAMGVANGVSYIPRLASELRRLTGKDVFKFYLLGDGAKRHEAEQLAEKLGVLNSSVFFLGRVTKQEVARWLDAADATIMTYDGPAVVFRDSVSNKFFDSLAARKPIIANFAGFSTLSAAEVGAGFIVDRDPAIAAKSLLELVKEPDLFVKAGNAAFNLAVQRFSRDTLGEQLERILQNVVNEKRK